MDQLLSKTEKIKKQALIWTIQGKRKTGRLKMTWCRTIINEINRRNKPWSKIKCFTINKSLKESL